MSDPVFRSKREAAGPKVRSGRALICRMACVVGTLLGTVFIGVFSRGAEEQGSEPSINYRRIFVPAENVAAWPRAGEKFLPVESRDLEKWISAANTTNSDQGPRASITRARYWARWDGKQTLSGRGEWTITLRGDEPANMPLEKLSMVTTDAHWQDEASPAVRLGKWGASSDLAKRMGLEVLKSGVLEFDWRLPIETENNGVEIPWHLPPATSTLLTIVLPADKRPLLEGSVDLEVSEPFQEDVTDTALTDIKENVEIASPMPPIEVRDAKSGSLEKAVPTRWRRWVMQLAPESHSNLRIVDEQGGATARASTFLISEHLNYLVTDRGVEILAKLELSDATGLRRELGVALPSGIQLISATVDGRELPWRMAGTTQLGEAKAIVELPNNGDNRSVTVTLRAWQGLVLDKPWLLPKLRPDDAFWSSGTLALAVLPSLELTSLVPTDCLQTSAKLANSKSDQPETCSFTSYSPTANVELRISRRSPGVVARVGTIIQIGDPDISGKLVAQVEVDHGNVHMLSADLEPRWLIEGVETVPASALAKWYIDGKDDRHTLQLQLADSVRPGHGITVITTGRLQRSGSTDPVSARTISMLRWRDLKVARNLSMVEPIEPYHIEAVGNLPLVEIQDLTTEDRSLFGESLDGQLFDLSRASDNATFRQSRKQSTYSADIEVDATLTGKELRQIYRVKLQPETGRIERLLVFVSEPVGDDLRWTDDASGAQLSADRLAADDPRISRFPASGEFWLVRLKRPVSRSTEISATRVTPWQERKSLPLLSLPDATQQYGRVVLRASGVESAVPEAIGLHPTGLPFEAKDIAISPEVGRAQAAYRYEPSDCVEAESRPALWLRPIAASEMPQPVSARRIDLESFVAADGSCTHRVTYHLENHGANGITLTLPAGAQLESAQVDGRPLNLPAPSELNEKVSLPLLSGARSMRLSLEYKMKLAALGGSTDLESPLPKGTTPITGGEWTIWLPEDYVAVGAGLVPANDAFSWRQRLFGPIGRPANERPFDALRFKDWQAWIFGLPTEPETVSKTSTTKQAIPAGPDGSSATRLGWHAYRQSFVAGAPTSIKIARPDLANAWSLAAFLFAFVAGVLVRGRRRELYIASTAIAAVLCLLLPVTIAPLATGAFGGMLLSLVAAWPLCKVPRDARTQSWHRVRKATAVITLALLLARGVLAQSADSTGLSEKRPGTSPIEVNATPPEPSTSIHSVLIPIDSSGKAVGNKVYVDERFLGQLMREASIRSHPNDQWLLRKINCQGELVSRQDSPGLAAGNWSLTFDVEVLTRDTTLVLPLNHEEATWSSSALLDGIPTPLTWHANGSSCAITVREPGRYELVITGIPRARDAAGRGRIELAMPPLAGTTFKLSYPSPAMTLELLGAAHVERNGASTGMLQAELDGMGRLVVSWPQQQVLGGAAQDHRITELRWLHVDPEGVELKAKYLIEGNATHPDSVAIAFDPRWELIPDGESSSKVQVENESENRHVITTVPLPSRAADRSEIELRFRLAKRAVLGRLQIPRLELMALPITHSLLAVSSDDALECEVLEGRETASSTVEDFLTAWGDGTNFDRPKILLANVPADSTCNLAVRRRNTESEIDEVLHVAAGASALRLQYQAGIVPNVTHRCQITISIPVDLVIEEITLQQSDRQIPLRWVRSAENRLQVFFGEVVDNPYRLVLSGHVPVINQDSCSLPRIISTFKEGASERIELYREPGALVEVHGTQEDNVEEQSAGLPPAGWNARPIGSYQFDRVAADRVRLSIAPNKPETVGETLTTLTRDGNGWSASFAGRLAVKSGTLDSLQLRIPGSWPGPFELYPSGQANIAVSKLDSQQSMLTVTMPIPVEAGKELEFEIRGSLAPAAAVSVAVPNIMPNVPAEWTNYVAVPTTPNPQPVTWTATGAEPAELPVNLQANPSTPLASQTFRVTSTPFRIELGLQKSTQPVATVRLADTVVVANSSGGQLLTTRFVITPQNVTECDLRLPKNQELISVGLDSRPALIRSLGGPLWRIQLGPPQFPQWIEVVTRGTADTASNGRTIAISRPALFIGDKPIDVEMSLWSLFSAHQHSSPRCVGASGATALEQMAARLDRLVGIAESATPAAAAASPPDGIYWYLPWAKRLENVRNKSQVLGTSSGVPQIIAEGSGTAESQLKRASQRIDAWIEQCEDVLEWPAEVTPALAASEQLLDEQAISLPAGGDWSYFVADGGADGLTVEFQSIGVTPTQARASILLAIVGLAAVSIWAVRVPAARDLFWRWPQAVGVLVGLVYWAWLWPSGLGLLIVAASVLLLFQRTLPGRSIRAEGTTVLRLSNRS